MLHPRRSDRARILRGAALLAALSLCACRAERPKPDNDRQVEIFFTTQLMGRISPDPQVPGPAGGLERIAARVKSERHPHLLLDAGGLLFSASKLDPAARPEAALRAALIARVYRQLGAGALNLSNSEFAAGAAQLRALQVEGATPFVSANLRPRRSGPSVARSYIRRVGGVTIGVTGVTAADPRPPPGLAVLEPISAAAAELRSLRRRGAELTILLAYLDDAGVDELAEALPEVDLIIQGRGNPNQAAAPPARRVGEVIILGAGQRGRYLGQLSIRLGASSVGTRLRLNSSQPPSAEARRLPLEAALPKDPDTHTAVRAYEEARAALSP